VSLDCGSIICCSALLLPRYVRLAPCVALPACGEREERERRAERDDYGMVIAVRARINANRKDTISVTRMTQNLNLTGMI
jgi:hypothetical protein